MSAEAAARGDGAVGHALPPAGFALLGALSLFWGLNWPFMKIALGEIPVWPFRSLCLIAGGGALLAVTALGGRSLRIPVGQFRPLVVCALFNVVGWHLFSGYGVAAMPAGRASIVAFTMPVWASLLGWLVLGEAITRTKLIGLGLGVAGLAALVGPDLRSLETAPFGALYMLGAALSWATGTVLVKRVAWTLPVTALAGWQLTLGSVPIVVGTTIMGDLPDPAEISPAAWGALAYILVMPMMFCHWAWFKVVSLFPAAIAAIGTLAIPVIGVFASAGVLGEPVGARELGALALVCAALAVVLVIPAWRRSAPS